MNVLRCGWSLAAFIIVLVVSRQAQAAEPDRPRPKPVPALQVLPLPDDQASFQDEGRELTRYHFGATLERPFLYPLVGPSGRSLTRMGHPHDPITHSHHNSVWISHYIVGDTDFWGDRGKGRIVHERLEEYVDGAQPVAASLTAVNAWTKTDGTVLMRDRRRIRVTPCGGDDEFLVTIDLEFFVDKQPITLGKTAFGIIGVRMAKTIGVKDGGGRILNSEGAINEAEVFWKPARWCDYAGPIAPKKSEGITLLDHPSNPNHPTVFHVRDDGWMGASLTYDAPQELTPGKPLRLRYGLYVHAGMPGVDELDEQWSTFAAEQPPETLAPPKKRK